MSEYFLAPALVKLRDEVNKHFPKRDKASDGWIGDASHSARPSDHNPDWNAKGRARGIVRALDIDISPDGKPRVDLRTQLLKILIGDPRVWYVISNGKIYSRTYNWTARTYTGSNGHFHHVHVSLIKGSSNFDTSNWFPEPKPAPHHTRIENFRDSSPEWNVNILDRAVKAGRVNLKKYITQIEDAVAALPHDEDDSRVNRFVERFNKERIIELSLLDEAVKDGRLGVVKAQRDALRNIIKSVLWR